MDKEIPEIYTDCLLCSFGQASPAGLSDLLDNAPGRDKITRFLPGSDFCPRELRQPVKPAVRSAGYADGVLISDDTAEEKSRTDGNEIITRHSDHGKKRTVRCVKIPGCLCHTRNSDIPAAFEIIRKPVRFCDPGDHRRKRRSGAAKNGLMRSVIKVCVHNNLLFRYIPADCRFSSGENMSFVRPDTEKDFPTAPESGRTAATDNENREKGRFAGADPPEPDSVKTVFPGGVPFPAAVCRQIFIN